MSESNRFSLFTLFVVIVLQVSPVSWGSAFSAQYEVFVDLAGGLQTLAGPPGARPEVVEKASRWRVVGLAQVLSQADGLRPGDILSLNLFEGLRHEALVDRVTIYGGRTVSVRARVAGYPEGYFLISTTGGRSVGCLDIPGRHEFYAIVSAASGLAHYVAEVDPALLRVRETANDVLVPPVKPHSRDRAQDATRLSEDSSSAVAEVDLMIVYTPAARQWAEANGGVDNIIAQAMERSQLVLDNSLTQMRLRLVHTAEVNYVETGNANVDLLRLTASETWNPWGNSFEGYDLRGYMDEVHAWRDRYAADLVSLLVARAEDAPGLAWLLTNPAGDSRWGFSVLRIEAAPWTYTLIHELGHNMGCGHHREQNIQPGPGLFSYSAGWRWVSGDGNRYCSVMTYGSGEFFSDGQTHWEVPHFSNPSVSYLGTPTGHPELGDNARTIRDVRHVIAGYRRPPSPILMPEGGVFHEPVAVTVTGRAPWTVLRYTTNGLDPTEADPVVASGGTILVDRSMTLKVRGWTTEGKAGSVSSGVFRLVAQAPKIRPGGGRIFRPTTVTITCDSADSVIRFTTNGKDPTESDPIVPPDGQLVVDSSLTLKAKAWRSGMEPSEVTTAHFKRGVRDFRGGRRRQMPPFFRPVRADGWSAAQGSDVMPAR